MNLTAESYGHAVILNLKGEMTEDSLTAFQKDIERHLASEKVVDLVLNLQEVPFIDSANLEYLLELQERLAEKFGQIKLTCCDANIQKILEITRLARSFETYCDVNEAVKSSQA